MMENTPIYSITFLRLLLMKVKSALRPMMELTACANHGVADGTTVARFLADLKNAMENPYLLI